MGGAGFEEGRESNVGGAPVDSVRESSLVNGGKGARNKPRNNLRLQKENHIIDPTATPQGWNQCCAK